ncbi:hypothetical protein Tco_1143222 [Tanacetum coccineum]
MIESLIPLCNTLNARCAIQPAANGHFYDAPIDPTFLSKKIFTCSKEKLHDAFLGSGDYKDLILQNGMFGLGFKRVKATDGSVLGFGHAGLGGSTAYCDINNRFAISVTINKLSFGALTWEIIRFICSELDLHLYTLPIIWFAMKSYNNDVKYGYVQKDLTKDETEYLKLFEEEIEERLKHRRQMRRWEMFVNGRPLGSRRERPE